MAPGADHMDSGRAVGGRHTSSQCGGAHSQMVHRHSATGWAREHTGVDGHCDMGIAVDRKRDMWTILKCEKQKGRRLDLKGRTPARGSQAPWLCVAGASMNRDLAGGVRRKGVQTQDALENSMRKVRGRSGAGLGRAPASAHPTPALALVFSD